jgi:hypothetical protein
VLLVGEGKGVVYQGVKIIFTNLLITDVNTAVELGKIDVDPVWIFRSLFKKSSVFHDPCISRIFETVRITRLVERLVGFLWKIYSEITSRFIAIIAVAGK